MACALTTDYTFLGCKGGVGGIKAVYMTEWANLTGTGSTYTEAAGIITAWTLATGKKFRTYLLDQEMGMFTDPGSYKSESGAIIHEPEVSFTTKDCTIAQKVELELMAKNYLCMIVRDENDKYWAFGYDRPMDLVTWGNESGTKLDDVSGMKLTFKGRTSTHIKQVTSSLMTVLTT